MDIQHGAKGSVYCKPSKQQYQSGILFVPPDDLQIQGCHSFALYQAGNRAECCSIALNSHVPLSREALVDDSS